MLLRKIIQTVVLRFLYIGEILLPVCGNFDYQKLLSEQNSHDIWNQQKSLHRPTYFETKKLFSQKFTHTENIKKIKFFIPPKCDFSFQSEEIFLIVVKFSINWCIKSRKKCCSNIALFAAYIREESWSSISLECCLCERK